MHPRWVAVDEVYTFRELDNETRQLMLDELEQDVAEHGHPYRGTGTLTEAGLNKYAGLLTDALTKGNEGSLVAALNGPGLVASPVSDAARRLGWTEFNRYYIRGICRRAAAHGVTAVHVYRARVSMAKRTKSEELDNQSLSAPRILANLRGNLLDPDSGLGRVNSGITLRCGCQTCLAVT